MSQEKKHIGQSRQVPNPELPVDLSRSQDSVTFLASVSMHGVLPVGEAHPNLESSVFTGVPWLIAHLSLQPLLRLS